MSDLKVHGISLTPLPSVDRRTVQECEHCIGKTGKHTLALFFFYPVCFTPIFYITPLTSKQIIIWTVKVEVTSQKPISATPHQLSSAVPQWAHRVVPRGK